MKAARWITGVGSFVLFASAIFHATGYVRLVHRIEASAVPYPLSGILKSTWLAFSVQLLVLAAIAFRASESERGGWIVLLCAASTGLTCLILFHFLGLFVGVYLTAAVTLLFLIGGWMQVKQIA
jgi:hypothetical protein